MKFAPRPFPTEHRRRSAQRPRGAARRVGARGGFTLVEVLAALLMMAIIIPVAMEGMSVASRVGVLGQRKAAAMRVAERVLNELIVEDQTQQSSASGTAIDGEISYPWAMRSQSWSEDAMLEMVVTVTFTVQGQDYDVSAATLIAPASTTIEAVAAASQ
jgi:prepilin-type N-terminal cleavage/methylation domain-containing protein